MTNLLIAEHDNNTLSEATAKTLTAATQIGGDIHILIAGKDCKSVADQAAKLSGVAKVLHVDDDLFAHPIAESMSDLIVPLMDNYDVLLSPADTASKDFMPRISALLDSAQISEITGVISPDTFERPVYAGNAIQTVQSSDAKKVITVRTTAFALAKEGGSADIETISAPAAQSLRQRLPDLPRLRHLICRQFFPARQNYRLIACHGHPK